MALKFTTSYLEDSLALFRYYKKLAEDAMEQATDEQLFATRGAAMADRISGAEALGGTLRRAPHRCPATGCSH